MTIEVNTGTPSDRGSPLLDVRPGIDGAPDPNTDWDRTSEENRKLAADWKTQIELAERRNTVWEKRCERIIKRFRDERQGTSTSGAELDVPRRMNILWSNVQVLTPSIYGKEPVPIVERKFLDRDPTGRVGSQILERAIRNELPDSGFHDSMNQVVQDYLLVGRGICWLRYKPLIGEGTSLPDNGTDTINPSGGDDQSDPQGDHTTPPNDDEDEANLSDASKQEIDEKLLGATLEVDYVHWKDFLHAKARYWKENEWVARRVYLSRQDCIDHFGEVVGKEIPLEMTPEVEPGAIGNRVTRHVPEDAKKAIVYEIWFKPKRKVYFIAKGYEFLLKEPPDDPLALEGFWPCPRPLFATMTNDTLEPVPDYIEYQDQALEIDQLTNRIDNLIKALMVRGVYNAAEKQIARLLDEGQENQLIPVSNWAALAEKGGIAGAVSFMPIKEVGDALLQLFQARDKIKNDLYEITGIADIMRGQADPRETAQAISTKGRWGSLRLQQRQAEVARFCRDVIKMMGEVICDHFPDDSLVQSSGIMYDEGIGPEPPKPPAALPPATQAGPPTPPPSAGPAPPPGMVAGGVGPGPQSGPINPTPQGMMSGPPSAPINPAIAGLIAHAQYQQAVQAAMAAKMAIINKAIQLLRNDKLRGFRIDIETDSTINDSAKEEKAERVEFLSALSGFIEKGMQASQMYPDILPLLGKSILFTVRGFRVGRDLESSIEEFIDKAEADAKAQAGKPKPPTPEQIKANADIQMAQMDLQQAQIKSHGDQAKAQAEIQAQQIQAQAEQQNMMLKQQMMQMEFRLKQMEQVMKSHEIQQEMGMREKEQQYKLEQMELDRHEDITQRFHDAHERREEAALAQSQREHELQTQEHSARIEAQAATHTAKLKAHDQQLKMREKHPNKPLPKQPKMPESPFSGSAEAGPLPGARKAKDGKWYIPDHNRPGKYLRVDHRV